jgi:DNA-directed RNA polymerase subunit RPC12/RpoP
MTINGEMSRRKISVETTWEDSGYDCDHCGGKILIRTDRETGQPKRRCYQCEQCGCQWKMNGNVLRIGSGRRCRNAQEERLDDASRRDVLTQRFVIILGIVALLLIARFGGMAALRFIIPLGLAVAILIWMSRYARERGWW